MPVEWDFFNRHVQKGLPHGQYVSARSILIGSGPPNLVGLSAGANETQSDIIYSLGVTQSVQINTGRQLTRIFEIGSERHYFINGRSIPTLALSRILYHGPNILRALMAHYSSTAPTAQFNSLLSRYKDAFPVATNKHTVRIPPGHENFFMNLASDLFSQPLGLLFLLRDEDELGYGAFYAENCYVENYSMVFDSQSIIITETTNIQAERFVPINSELVEIVKVLDEELVRPSEEGDLPQPATA